MCGWLGWGYHPFSTGTWPLRLRALCPDCGSLERHRLIKLVLDDLGWATWSGRLLHFAPERCLRRLFQEQAGTTYCTVDLRACGVDCWVDVERLPFAGASFDFVVCSSVLQFVRSDALALAELRRVLSPRGVLLLCVPVTQAGPTLELGGADPSNGHMRHYGNDVIERAAQFFAVEDRSAGHHPSVASVKFGLNPADVLLICR